MEYYWRVENRQFSPSLSDQIERDRRQKAYDKGKVYPLVPGSGTEELAGQSAIGNCLLQVSASRLKNQSF
jgi:hypothetical protein